MYVVREVKNTLIGNTITEIRMDDDYLVLTLSGREHIFLRVEGDCCSNSRFFDFYGVKLLLAGHTVTDFEGVSLDESDTDYKPETWEGEVDDNETRAYGFRFTVEHRFFGSMSAVVSFRNYSNGYYGGWCETFEPKFPSAMLEAVPLITEDVIGS